MTIVIWLLCFAGIGVIHGVLRWLFHMDGSSLWITTGIATAVSIFLANLLTDLYKKKHPKE